MHADFARVSEQPQSAAYYLVRAHDLRGGEETWLLTESELRRIRERASDKAAFTKTACEAFAPLVSGWRATLVRWLGGFV